MNRRDFIKSTAIGLGAITVPLMVSAKTRSLTARDITKLAFEKIDMELSEQALEDLLVELDKYRGLAIKPTHLVIHPSWLN